MSDEDLFYDSESIYNTKTAKAPANEQSNYGKAQQNVIDCVICRSYPSRIGERCDACKARQTQQPVSAHQQAEQNVLAIRGSYDAPGSDACVEAEERRLAEQPVGHTSITEHPQWPLVAKEQWEAEQVLGRALGYPWYKDDRINFPEATEADGVCTGENTLVTIAMEAASRLMREAQQPVDMPEVDRISRFRQWIKNNPDGNKYAKAVTAMHRYFEDLEDGFGNDPYHDNEAMKAAMATLPEREAVCRWNYDFGDAPKDGTEILVEWSEKDNPRGGGYELRALASFDIDFNEWDSDDRVAEKLLMELHDGKLWLPTRWMLWPTGETEEQRGPK